MRIVFMGSAEVSGIILQALVCAQDIEVVAAITAPDKPAGRCRKLQPCACKARAAAQKLEVLSPPKINAPDVLEKLAGWAPEVIVVVAYGQFLGSRLLALPPLGCVNVHFSLLPRHRGAAPIQRAIAAGDTETGVTVMRMDAGMDSGDILLQAAEPILPDDTAGSLHDRLAPLGATLLLRALRELHAGRLEARPQDPAGVTFAPKLHKDEGRLDWSRPAVELARLVRAFNPWPACFTWLPARVGRHDAPLRLKVLAAAAEPAACAEAPPGTVVDVNAMGLAVATGVGRLRLLRVQPEGGKPMDGLAFLHGHALRPGDRLDASELGPG